MVEVSYPVDSYDKLYGDALPPEGGAGPTVVGERTYGRDEPAPGGTPANSRSIQLGNCAPEDDDPTKANGDQRISRSKWPKDQAKRRAELVKILPQAVKEYFGNITVIAHRLNVEEAEIEALATERQEIAAAFAGAGKLLNALLEDRLTTVALTGNSGTDCRFLLERRMPETYGKPAPQKPGRKFDLPPEGLQSAFDPASKAKQ